MEKKIFNNTKGAFSLKSDKDLKDSIFVFKMMSRSWMVSFGSWLTKVSLKLHLPVKGIIKKTIFNQFCGGETREECLPVIKKMMTSNVHTVFDYASEIREKKDAEFDKDLEIQLQIAAFAKGRKAIPFMAVKPSNLGSISTYTAVSAGEKLTPDLQKSWDKIKKRFDTLAQKASDYNLRLQIDAEESWTQTAVDKLVEDLMAKFNKEKVVVYNTVQCYRWDRLQYVKDLHERAQKANYKIGLKMVRGAYMEKENAKAAKEGYPTPICEDKEATDVNYNTIIHYCLKNIDDFSIYVGTHNEVSSYLTMQLMDQAGIKPNDDRVWFSQLYGMSDNITFNLALHGYNAAKYMPFGKVGEVIPYLIRRAEENTSVKGQTGRELALLLEEKNRRKGTYVKRVN